MAAPQTFEYNRVVKCSGGPQLGAMALYRYILDVWDMQAFGTEIDPLGVYNCRNTRGGSSLSEHAEGRALDLGLNAFDPDELEVGNRICQIFEIEHAPLGIQSIVWNGEVWGYTKGTYWRKLSRKANQHTDHIHVGLNWWAARNLTSQRVASILSKYPELEADHVGQRWTFRIKPTKDTPPGRDAGYIAEVGKPLQPINGAPELSGVVGYVAAALPPFLWTEIGNDFPQYDFRGFSEITYIPEPTVQSMEKIVSEMPKGELTTSTLRKVLAKARISFDD